MGFNHLFRHLFLTLGLLAFSANLLMSDEPAGLSSLLSDAEVRAKLKLPAERQVALDELLAKRAAEQAKLVEALKTAPQQLRDQKLGEFDKASDKLLNEFLSAEEKEVVEKARMARVGFIALGEKSVQQRLRISDEQRSAIEELLAERAEKLKGLDKDEAVAVFAGFEIRLAKVLEPKQMLGWRTLIGEVDADAVDADLLAKVDEEEAEDKPADEPKKSEPKPAVENPEDIRLTFSFGKEDWKEVIEWFADQAQLNLNMPRAPEGTLNYQDKTEYTVAEAMDFLNSLLLREDFTLVRNKQMLMVIDLEDGIPASVIETINDPAELDNRGKYEIVKCAFHFKDVNGEDFADEIEGLINKEKGQGSLQYFPSTNSLIVQETGGTLRTIRTILEAAEKRAAKKKRPIESLVLKHVNVEELMSLARPFFGMKENENSTDKDGMQLTVVPEVFGKRLFFSGAEETVDRFKSFVEEYDIPGEGISESSLEKNVFKTYAPQTDPVLIEQVLRRIFGTEEGMRLARNETTGFIVVEAKPSQHEKVKAAIESMESETATTEVITLTKYEPSDLIPMLKSLFHVPEATADGKTPAGGTLSLEEDDVQGRLVVRGTPYQVAEIKRIINMLDPPIGSKEFQRSELRRIPISGQSAARALESTAQIWPFMARENRITFVVPGKGEFNPANPVELKEMLGDQGIIVPGRIGINGQPGEDELPLEDKLPLENELKNEPETEESPKSEEAPLKEAEPKEKPKPAAAAAFQKRELPFRYVAALTQDPASPQASPAGQENQTPAAESGETRQKSVPGADVMVQVNRNEIILYSKDLDTLDVIEQLLLEQTSSSLESENPTVFLLEHRSAEEVKSELEEVLGISSSGGGGGGGLGGMLGGMAQNMLGPAGGMVQGLLGGGGGGSSSAVLRTAGDVTIVADLKLNALIVFAIQEDLDKIKLLLQVIDQKEALQNPNLDGKTYKIPIVYVNASELVDIVKAQLAARVKSAQGGQQDGGQQNQQMQMLQALMQGGRGGRGGGGAQGSQQQSPQFSITAYDKANWILVTGPEFLYKQVEEIVLLLDTPQALARQPKVTVIAASGVNPELLTQALQAAYGDKLTTSSSSSTTNRTGTATTQRSPADIQNMMQQRGIPTGGFGAGGFGGGGIPGGGIPGGGFGGGGFNPGGFGGGPPGGFGGRGGGGGTGGRGGR